MAKRWSIEEKRSRREELIRLYVKENKSISQIAQILNIGQSTVYDRLVKLKIASIRYKKERYNNIRRDIIIPNYYSSDLAEFIGVLLGDGHISVTQVTVTLGSKDEYVEYINNLIKKIFKIDAKIFISSRRHYTIYFGSTAVVRWLCKMGLVFNKVKAQVDIPCWILTKKEFMRSVIRGLFDTDGSVYKLKFGMQMSFCNHSKPLLISIRLILLKLGFHPSKINNFNLYLTRKSDLKKFYKEIGFNNLKHRKRFIYFMGASHSGNCSGL